MRTARANTILVGPIPASSTHGEAVPILDERMANALAGPIPGSGTHQEAVSVLSKREANIYILSFVILFYYILLCYFILFTDNHVLPMHVHI